MDLRKLEELVSQIAALLPAGGAEISEEVRANLRIVLEATLNRMNLVTREEFDAQSELLRRTREKLERLESLVAEMEAAESDS